MMAYARYMREQLPTFDEDEFNEAIEESFGVARRNDEEVSPPPDSDDAAPGQDEVPDIM